MWTAEIQDGDVTVSSTTTGTSSSSKRPLELSINDTRDANPNVLTPTSECSGDKRQKTSTSSDQLEQTPPKTDPLIKEAVRKWQLSNLAECVFHNNVNMVLESLPEETSAVRQEAFNMANSYNIEDEAVLMAIEEHGLRHQTQSDCSPSPSSTEDSSCCSSTSSADLYQRTSSTTTDTYSHGQDNQEFNFENNFLVTAVSAAIEEKGLSMYPV